VLGQIFWFVQRSAAFQIIWRSNKYDFRFNNLAGDDVGIEACVGTQQRNVKIFDQWISVTLNLYVDHDARVKLAKLRQ